MAANPKRLAAKMLWFHHQHWPAKAGQCLFRVLLRHLQTRKINLFCKRFSPRESCWRHSSNPAGVRHEGTLGGAECATRRGLHNASNCLKDGRAHHWLTALFLPTHSHTGGGHKNSNCERGVASIWNNNKRIDRSFCWAENVVISASFSKEAKRRRYSHLIVSHGK